MSQAYSDNRDSLMQQWAAAGGTGDAPMINTINGADGSSPTYYMNMPTAASPAASAMQPGPTQYAPSAGTPPNPLTTQSLAGGPSSGGDPVSQLQGQYAQNSGVTPANSWATGTFGTGLGSVPAGVGGAVGGPTPVGGTGGTGTGTWGSTAAPGGWLPPGPRDTGAASWQLPGHTGLGGGGPQNPADFGLTAWPGNGNVPMQQPLPLDLSGNTMMQQMPGFTAPSTGGPDSSGMQQMGGGYTPQMSGPNTSGMQPMGPGYTPQQSNPTMQSMGGGYVPQQSDPNSLMQMGGAAYSPLASAGYGYNPVDHDPFAPPGA